MALETLDYINGPSSIIFVGISVILGLKIISKYFEYKKKELLYVGLTWILMTEMWWSSSSSFIVALFNNGEGLSVTAYVLIANLLVPVALFVWLLAFTELTITLVGSAINTLNSREPDSRTGTLPTL